MSTTTTNGHIFRVYLEKKGRARGTFSGILGRPWTARTFKLQGQCLQYYDRNELRGEINLAHAKVFKLNPSDADNKPFPLELICANNEKVVLNASCEEVRLRCLEVFALAASSPFWSLPGSESESSRQERITSTETEAKTDTRNVHTLWLYDAVNDDSVEDVQDVFEKFKNSVDIDFVHPEEGQTILTVACCRGELDLVRFLIETCRANVNLPNSLGLTALMVSAKLGNKELMDYLLNTAKASANAVNQNGESAFDLCKTDELRAFLRGDDLTAESEVVVQDEKVSERDESVVTAVLSQENVQLKVESKTSECFDSKKPKDSTSKTERNGDLIEGLPRSHYLALLHISLALCEQRITESVRARNVSLAKRYSQRRDDMRRRLSEPHIATSTLCESFVSLSTESDRRQWMESQLDLFVQSIWDDESKTESEKFDAIERATTFVNECLHVEEESVTLSPSPSLTEENATTVATSDTVASTEQTERSEGVLPLNEAMETKATHRETSDTLTLRTQLDLTIWAKNPHAVVRIDDAEFLSPSQSTQRVSVSLARSEHSLSLLQSEFESLSALYAQSSRVVLRPIGVLSSKDNSWLCVSCEEERESVLAALRDEPPLCALLCEHHGERLSEFLSLSISASSSTERARPLSQRLRLGERLMAVESLVEVLQVAHNCGLCLLRDLSPQNLVRSLDTREFVLAGLTHAVRVGSSLSPQTLASCWTSSALDCQFCPFEVAALICSENSSDAAAETKKNVLAQSVMDLPILGWLVWETMGGASYWMQHATDCDNVSEILRTMASLSMPLIEDAVKTAFPHESKSSLRRLLLDLLQVDPTRRCDLREVYDDYAFFGRCDVDRAEERAQFEQETSRRIAAEEESQRLAALQLQEHSLCRQTLELLIQQLDTLLRSEAKTHETPAEIFGKLLQRVRSELAAPCAAWTLFTSIAPLLHPTACTLSVLQETLRSLLVWHVDDIIDLQSSSHRVRNELRQQGNQMPQLFCMLPMINNSSAAQGSQSQSSRSTSRQMQQFKHLFWNRSRLVFICPVTLRIMQSGRSRRGYQLDPPEQWVLHAAPLLKTGILCLKLALLMQDRELVPAEFQMSFKDLDAVMEMLCTVSSLNEIGETAENARASFSEAENNLGTVLNNLFEHVGHEEGVDVHKLFSTWRLQRTGLTFVTFTKARKTCSAWVSEYGRSKFEENGEDAFLF